MLSSLRARSVLTSVCVLALSQTALAAPLAPFAGPSGWTKTDVASSTPTRTVEQWHIGGDTSVSVTYTDDSTTAYAASLAAIQSNFTSNHIKPALDKDVPCRGTTGHVIEFTFGPTGAQTIVNRLLVPDGSGVAMITYSRAVGNPFDSDVQTAETAYCGAPVP